MGKEDWRERLDKALKATNQTMRSVSIASGHGAGYVHSLLKKDKKGASVDNLIHVCDAAKISIGFVVAGIEMTRVQQDFLLLLADLKQEDQENLLKLAESVRAGTVRT